MDNKLNEIRRKIRFLRSEMLGAGDHIRQQVNRDEDCSAAAIRLMSMRVAMLGLISERNRLGGEERLLNVDERLKLDVRAAGRKPANGMPAGFPAKAWSPRQRPERAVSDDIVEAMRRRIGELDQLARRLDQSGLDNARARLLLARKRAELEDFMNRGRDVSTAQMVRPQRG